MQTIQSYINGHYVVILIVYVALMAFVALADHYMDNRERVNRRVRGALSTRRAAAEYRYIRRAGIRSAVKWWIYLGRIVLERWRYRGLFPYVNTYATGRSYGGPEEGGWWYDTGRPVSSRRVPLFLADWYRRRLRRAYELERPQWYMRPGASEACDASGTHAVYIEPYRGRAYPEENPRYC